MNASSVHLNRALALARQNLFDEALTTLFQVTDPDLELRRESARAGFLLDAGRYPEAVLVAQKARDREWGEHADELLATVQADLAWALHKMGASRERVEDEAWRALDQDRQCQRALRILRELHGRTSASASYYRLLLRGRNSEDPDDETGGVGFYVTYDVVADTPEDALALAVRHEPESLRDGLQIDQCEQLEPRPDEPLGVYWLSGRTFFPDDATE